MTDEQKYGAVLKELGALLADKNATISFQRWQVDQLKEKLKAAEAERDNESHEQADAIEQLNSVNKALRKCVNLDEKKVVDFDGMLELQKYIQTAVEALKAGGAA